MIRSVRAHNTVCVGGRKVTANERVHPTPDRRPRSHEQHDGDLKEDKSLDQRQPGTLAEWAGAERRPQKSSSCPDVSDPPVAEAPEEARGPSLFKQRFPNRARGRVKSNPSRSGVHRNQVFVSQKLRLITAVNAA